MTVGPPAVRHPPDVPQRVPPRLALAALLLAGTVIAWLARRTAAPGGILERRYALLAEIGAWWLVALLACLLVRALPRRTAVVAVLLVGAVVRLAAVAEKAPMSDDLYRYAWDGVVQLEGIDPYRYPPSADELRHLRTEPGLDWLWPPELADSSPESLINRITVPTLYPPVGEAWFALEHLVVPLEARDRGYEAVGFGLDLAVLAALLALLRARGRDPRWIAVYALAPLPALEAVQNAHVDALAVLAVLGALAVAARRPALASGLLAAAALIKVYPGLLLVLLLRRRGSRVRVVAVAAGAAVLAYLPHVLAVGIGVLGYLPGYLGEERYDEGGRYLLVGLTGLTGAPATVAVVGALVALAGWLLRADLALPEAATRLLVGVFLLVTPVQPWYALLLLAVAVVAGAWWAVPVAAAPYPLFFATILDGPAVLAGRVSYGLAALGVLGAALHARRRRGQPAARPG